ncbi:uncharacterized protein si:ch73-173p19.1 [Hoplias malabaricus]|uniref:uncharacterized protein si:ch73-173p19.1 n=1 Tax=Hoplias malabaricus TaxID=27720 RepID=UPI0034633B7D
MEPATVGDFLSVLGEMGFSEGQIQDAMNAGCFTVAEAAEWLLQESGPRHSLMKKSGSPTNAFSAFNPPKNQVSPQSQSQQAGPALALGPAAERDPLQSRIKPNLSFEQQQRQRAAQEAQHQRKQKQQERELILKRIAEDRRSHQDKLQVPAASVNVSAASERCPNTVDNQCVLLIRLPSGESMRESFSADAPLCEVVEHITAHYPSLPAFSLLQGFPRKCFSEAELSSSLSSLGLTPNAALCVQTTAQESHNEVQSHNEEPSLPQGAAQVQEPLPPSIHPQLWEEAVEQAGIGPAGPSHHWGRGQRLVTGEDEDLNDPPEEPAAPLLNGLPLLPFRVGNLEPQHLWPEQGNRLREPGSAEPAVGHLLPGDAAVLRMQRATPREEPSPKKRPRNHGIPSLCSLATRASISLITAPCMQYSSSLSGLTSEGAELILSHMIRERVLRPRTLELFFGVPLQRFVLNSYPYTTNELLRQLRAFTALKHLSVVNSPLITDAGLCVLSSLLKLQHLNLSSCSKLTDSCLQHIINLQCLSFLSLDQTKVSDSGLMMYLRSAPPVLVHLSLNETAITETTLTAISQCLPQLRQLNIARTLVSDVSALAELRCLHTLHLDGTCVKEDSLQALGTHPSLSVLGLGAIPVASGNRTLEIISGLTLTQLTLPGRHSLTDAGLLFLSKQSLLSEVDLTDYTQITDQGIKHLASMTRLKKLSLSNTQVSDMGLLALVALKDLMELCLDRTVVSSLGVSALVTHLPYLQVIGLACTRVGDSVIRRGLIHCPQLIKLNLSRTRITDRGLRFLHRMKLLQVNLDGTGVTLEGVTNLIAASPHLSSIRASNTLRIPPDQQSDDES